MTPALQKVEAGSFVIEISADFDAISDEWRRLEADGQLTPFQTRAWLAPFYQILAPQLKAKPVFVLVREKATGRPAMLLPLCARRHFGVTVFEFADLGVSDFNAPILAPFFDPSRDQWRVLWRAITAAFGGLSLLLARKAPRLIGGRRNPMTWDNERMAPMTVSTWGLNLPPSIPDYNNAILRGGFVRELAKKSRRVARLGPVESVVAQSREERELAFDILARQRQARCDDMGRSNILARPAYRQFYRAVAVNTDEKLASFALMKVGGEIVATLFALRHRNAAYVIMSTFAGGEWKSLSLGNLLIRAFVERCIDEGVGFFDFTIGDESYKRDFGAEPSPLYFGLEALSLAAAPIAATLALGAKIKQNRNLRRPWNRRQASSRLSMKEDPE